MAAFTKLEIVSIQGKEEEYGTFTDTGELSFSAYNP